MWTAAENSRLVSQAPRFGRNWETISATLFGGKYSSRECRTQFEFLTEKPWTQEEDLKLVELKNQWYPLWGNVSRILNTGRTAISCEKRYNELMAQEGP
ncbi:unnamed protein product [Microthlaspi erraticum]|uniref:Myb-like domain-containing protein n=1 Tax=Microthlaspi erraticum TaxID=1685480 RepID=A0A6D2IGK0_9BRAS|nr:unnamed protein product [Microthlaspi erraticum]